MGQEKTLKDTDVIAARTFPEYRDLFNECAQHFPSKSAAMVRLVTLLDQEVAVSPIGRLSVDAEGVKPQWGVRVPKSVCIAYHRVSGIQLEDAGIKKVDTLQRGILLLADELDVSYA